MKKEPNPGSDEAIDLGCKCPVLDNEFGRGFGNGEFWINADCPLHSDIFTHSEDKPNKQLASPTNDN